MGVVSRILLFISISFQVLFILFLLSGCTKIQYIDSTKKALETIQINKFEPTEVKTLEDINLNYLNLYKCYLKNYNILETLKNN